MPKVKISENDFTGNISKAAVTNTVFIPIKSNKAFAATLFSSVAEFDKFAGSGDDATIDTTTNDAKMCIYLLKLGFEIVVQGLAGQGDDDSLKINWTALEDKNKFDLRFLTNGLKDEVCPLDMIKTAKNRGDCIALCNIANDENTKTLAEIRAAFTAAITDNDPAQYAAAFTPWFTSNHEDIKGIDIPAAFGYLFAYANSISNNNPEYYAIAGFNRGAIPGLKEVKRDYTSAEIEVLQGRSGNKNVGLDEVVIEREATSADNDAIAINPIAYIRPAGYIIYGNRTLKDNKKDDKGLGILTATSFLNVRNGLSTIKKVMYEASRKFAFEQNSEVLWINFQAYIKPLLDTMQTGNGILGYKFIKVNTDKKARLKAKLKIVPIEAVEDFELEVLLVDDLTVNE